MNVFAVERRNETLVQLGHDRVDRLVAPMFDGLHLVDPGSQVVGIFQNAAQQARTLSHVGGKLGKQIEKLGFARKKTDHDTVSSSKVETGYYLTPGQQHARKSVTFERLPARWRPVETRPAASPRVRPSLRARMRLVVNVHHVLDRELRVALRRRQPLMPKQFLDGAQVRSLFQHVRAESVTQSMRMTLWRQSLGNRDALDDASHAARRKPSAALVDKQRGHDFRRHAFRWTAFRGTAFRRNCVLRRAS